MAFKAIKVADKKSVSVIRQRFPLLLEDLDNEEFLDSYKGFYLLAGFGGEYPEGFIRETLLFTLYTRGRDLENGWIEVIENGDN